MDIATGSDLTAEGWADFVKRLRYHCRGEGVHDHYTANAIFIVEERTITYGIDLDYVDDRVVLCDGDEWFSPQEYWKDLDAHGRKKLNQAMQEYSGCQFMKASDYDQWHVLSELEDHTVTGWAEGWKYVNSHFTREAAEAFIARKKHDYRKGLRVYVDAQVYCWEFETIKNAIIEGRIGFIGE